MRLLRGAILLLFVTSLVSAAMVGSANEATAPPDSARAMAPSGTTRTEAETAGGTTQANRRGLGGAAAAGSKAPSHASSSNPGGVGSVGLPVTTTTLPPPAHGGDPGYPLEVTGPDCVKQGQTLKATIRTRPDADLGLIVSFADGDTHGTMQIQQADGQGVHTTAILITPKIPEGPATLLVSSGKDGQGAVAEFRFKVVRAGGACS